MRVLLIVCLTAVLFALAVAVATWSVVRFRSSLKRELEQQRARLSHLPPPLSEPLTPTDQNFLDRVLATIRKSRDVPPRH